MLYIFYPIVTDILRFISLNDVLKSSTAVIGFIRICFYRFIMQLNKDLILHMLGIIQVVTAVRRYGTLLRYR